MSTARLMVAGVEPSPVLDLVAGALLAGFGEQRPVRPILLGLDLSLWRLVYNVSARSPRVLDPVLFAGDVAKELCDAWAQKMDLALFIAVPPFVERWEGVSGSRPCDVAVAVDAPVVLVVDARERGASAAAALMGSRAMAKRAEIGGVIVVGADESPAAVELMEALRRDVGLPLLGRVPPQLSEQFVRQHASSAGKARTISPGSKRSASESLCQEAAGYLDLHEIEAIARRCGYVPSAPRRLLTCPSQGGRVSVAVAWGPPLQPLGLENIDVLQAMGVELVPLNLAKDRELPSNVDGVFLAGQIDEREIDAFAANKALQEELRAAISDGLPAVAMGGGALLLLQRLADSRGRAYDLVGVLPAEAELIETYDRPLYVRGTATRQNPFDEGSHVLYELFDLEFSLLEQGSFAYQVSASAEPHDPPQAEGFVVKRCLATTLSLSFATSPQLATRFLSVMRFLQGR